MWWRPRSYLKQQPQKLVGLYSSFILLLSHIGLALYIPIMTRHTSTPASCIHHTILCLLCIRCFTFLLSTSTRPPLIITPHTRTPLSSTLDVCSCPSLSSHFPTPFFLAHLCIPLFCVSWFFCPATWCCWLQRKDFSQVYIVLFSYLVVLAAFLYVDDYRQIYVLYI